MDEFKQENERVLDYMRKQAGIDSEKVKKVVSNYLQIARDNHLNCNEFLLVIDNTKDIVAQSLNRVSISTLPEIISDAAKV
nr:MAG TPA: hypothetical protein [Caudoviricetes sp.]